MAPSLFLLVYYLELSAARPAVVVVIAAVTVGITIVVVSRIRIIVAETVIGTIIVAAVSIAILTVVAITIAVAAIVTVWRTLLSRVAIRTADHYRCGGKYTWCCCVKLNCQVRPVPVPMTSPWSSLCLQIHTHHHYRDQCGYNHLCSHNLFVFD
jgi:hypothetical protein